MGRKANIKKLSRDVEFCLEVLGAPVKTAIVSYLFDNKSATVMELSDAIGVNRSTVHTHMHLLENLGIINTSTELGPGQRHGKNLKYSLNLTQTHQLIETTTSYIFNPIYTTGHPPHRENKETKPPYKNSVKSTKNHPTHPEHELEATTIYLNPRIKSELQHQADQHNISFSHHINTLLDQQLEPTTH